MPYQANLPSQFLKTAQEGTILISAASAGFLAGNFAKITINGIPVQCQKNENDNYRGLHVVVINPTNGEVCWAVVFDTYKSSDALNEFILRGLPVGYIVVAACKDECSTNMSVHARILFTDMGS